VKVHSLRIEGCILERVQLAGGQFGSATLKHVRLADCGLANMKAHRMALVRVELIGSPASRRRPWIGKTF